MDRNYRVSAGDGRTFLAKLRKKADRSDRLRWQKEILLQAMEGRRDELAVRNMIQLIMSMPEYQLC